MLGRASGVVFVLLLFLTSLLGSIFMLFPCIPLAIFAPKLWRLIADRFVGYWLIFPASLIDFVFGTRFNVTGDLIIRNKPGLIIMNHRTRLDWMFLWNALYKMDPLLLTTEKISLKAPLKRIPGAGWAMGCGSFLFLERNFESDKPTIEKMIQYYKESGRSYQLLLFPEGTDRGARALGISHLFAEKNGLPKYEHVLHPRTTGFNYLMNLMQNENYLEYVYDITLGYEGPIIESEMQLLREGVFPTKVHVDVKKYSISEIPNSAEGRSDWLTSLWEKKEQKLTSFYNGDFKLEPSGERFMWPERTAGLGYYAAFAFWILLSIFWIYMTYSFVVVQLYVVAAIVFFVFVLKKHNGIEFLVLKWFAEAKAKGAV